MSVFPRFATGEFAPLFRLLDDYATHTGSRSACPPTRKAPARAFQPRFDVKESKDSYELEGELPGIKQQDLSIEFTDPQTLSIRGKTERSYDSRTKAPAVESAADDAASEAGSDASYHKATVEDEDTPAEPSAVKQPSNEVVTKPAENTVAEQNQQPSHRYWVSERAVGEFQRTFNFPARIDQDHVKASLKDGILSIFVPKAQLPATRRINIE